MFESFVDLMNRSFLEGRKKSTQTRSICNFHPCYQSGRSDALSHENYRISPINSCLCLTFGRRAEEKKLIWFFIFRLNPKFVFWSLRITLNQKQERLELGWWKLFLHHRPDCGTAQNLFSEHDKHLRRFLWNYKVEWKLIMHLSEAVKYRMRCWSSSLIVFILRTIIVILPRCF